MSEVSNRRFVHFEGTRDEFNDTDYPAQYTNSIVFIDGYDNSEYGNSIYTHGKHYPCYNNILSDAQQNVKYDYNELSSWVIKSILIEGTGGNNTFTYKQGPTSEIETFVNNEYDVTASHNVFVTSIVPNEDASTIGTIVLSNTLPDYEEGDAIKTFITIGYKALVSSNDVSSNGSIVCAVESSVYGDTSFVEGAYNIHYGKYSHTEGVSNTNKGMGCHAEGSSNTINYSSIYSHIEGHLNEVKGVRTHVEGFKNFSDGENSHVEGLNNKSTQKTSHVEGEGNTNNAMCSHVEGKGNTNNAAYSHVEGFGNIVCEGSKYVHIEGLENKTIDHDYSSSEDDDYRFNYSTSKPLYCHIEGTHNIATWNKGGHAEGKGTFASGICSHSEGVNTTASGSSSHAEGRETTASGTYSHAEGSYTTASGSSSHAEGSYTTASGNSSHTEGYQTLASGDYSHAEGVECEASGIRSHAEGYKTVASYPMSHAEGYQTLASGKYSHAEGNKTSAENEQSHAEGRETTASGKSSHAEGQSTTASAPMSHAEGSGTTASGDHSHAEGGVTTASGKNSHAEGYYTKASGSYSHAEGYYTKASGSYSHAEGYNTTASGSYSHAEGYNTTASGKYSHASGYHTTTSHDYSFVCGKYNNDDVTNPLFIVGCGDSSTNRKNALTVSNERMMLHDIFDIHNTIDESDFYTTKMYVCNNNLLTFVSDGTENEIIIGGYNTNANTNVYIDADNMYLNDKHHLQWKTESNYQNELYPFTRYIIDTDNFINEKEKFYIYEATAGSEYYICITNIYKPVGRTFSFNVPINWANDVTYNINDNISAIEICLLAIDDERFLGSQTVYYGD